MLGWYTILLVCGERMVYISNLNKYIDGTSEVSLQLLQWLATAFPPHFFRISRSFVSFHIVRAATAIRR